MDQNLAKTWSKALRSGRFKCHNPIEITHTITNAKYITDNFLHVNNEHHWLGVLSEILDFKQELVVYGKDKVYFYCLPVSQVQIMTWHGFLLLKETKDIFKNSEKLIHGYHGFFNSFNEVANFIDNNWRDM